MSVSGIFVDRTADSLSHTNVVDDILIRPYSLRVPNTARPVVTPPSSNLYDCIRNRSPLSSPLPCRRMSSSALSATHMCYPTPKVTDPSVAMIIPTGVVGSHPNGVLIAGISPTNL
jgi:hypothetical protein